MDEDPDEFLRVADGIGRQLTREAIWHSDRCNWVGAEPRELLGDGKAYGPLTYQALTSDLYAGTSGVALFLAELSRRTGDSEAQRTALGAIRQAMSRLATIRPEVRLGLFTGWIGIAYAAARIADALGHGALAAQAAGILQRAASEVVDRQQFDVVSGRAGAIAALLALRPVLAEADLLDFAMRLGDDLLDTAVVSEIGSSWRDPQSRNRHNLTGFSHGTSGVASALLELRVASGDPRYGVAAESAFDYERHWFNPKAGNWPDFREQSYAGRRARQGPACATFWCHGAPGIALSRLRAYALLGDERCRREAEVALATTRRSIDVDLQDGRGNFSLCHGLAGNSESLLYGYETLGPDFADLMTASLAVARAGLERFSSTGAPWPCGTQSAESPGLMLGLAGIGHFYLRLHDPAIRWILILHEDGDGRGRGPSWAG